jgi:hypothetical protein
MTPFITFLTALFAKASCYSGKRIGGQPMRLKKCHLLCLYRFDQRSDIMDNIDRIREIFIFRNQALRKPKQIYLYTNIWLISTTGQLTLPLGSIALRYLYHLPNNGGSFVDERGHGESRFCFVKQGFKLAIL